jgi:hypothetical protein
VFLVATFATLVGLTCLAIAAFNFGNRWLDSSPPRRVEVNVVASRFPSRGGGGFVRVRGMPAAYAPSDAAGVATISGHWAQASSCSRAALRLHPGLFGVVWVESCSCAAWAGASAEPEQHRAECLSECTNALMRCLPGCKTGDTACPGRCSETLSKCTERCR